MGAYEEHEFTGITAMWNQNQPDEMYSMCKNINLASDFRDWKHPKL